MPEICLQRSLEATHMKKKKDNNTPPEETAMSVEELVFWTQEILRSDGTDSCWDVLLPPVVLETEKNTEDENNDTDNGEEQ